MNIQILNCGGEYDLVATSELPQKATISGTIKKLNIYCTQKWYIQKRCKSMRRLSSRSPICAWTNSRRVASQNVRKTGFYWRVFHSASLNFCCAINRKPGGDSTRRGASFSYTSLLCWTNGQILNCPGSFDGVFWKMPRETANRRGSNHGQHYSTWITVLGCIFGRVTAPPQPLYMDHHFGPYFGPYFWQGNLLPTPQLHINHTIYSHPTIN